MLNPKHGEQPTLFDLPVQGPEKGTIHGTAVFADPAFASNKSAPLHRWVPWIAGFSREFVQGALARNLQKQGTVLDPFAGVGTTLVEAILAGHTAIGFEINPYAALACQTKLRAYQLGPEAVVKATEAFQAFYHRATQDDAYLPTSSAPAGFKTRVAFYSPQVLQKVLIVHDFIAGLADEILRNIFQIAFASTMVRYSNYSYEPSLGRRATAGKEDYTVAFGTGLRPSEHYALQWEHVDFPHRLLHIRQGYVRGRMTLLKTAGSRRDVEMLPHVKEALRQQHDATYHQGPYVFANTEGGPLHRDNMRNRVWNPALVQAGLRHRNPYQTRHTFASLMLEQHEDPAWVARMLGHTSLRMLYERYGKFIRHRTRHDGERFTRALRAAAERGENDDHP